MNSPTVATSQVLQHLYSLDNTSPDLLPNLRHLIQNEDKEQYLSGLQGADLVRLVDFLDKVLDIIPITEDIYRRCLHRLQTICNLRRVLPSSYNVSGDLARVDDYPIAYGGFSDVWEGIHNNRKVCIKCLRITKRDREKVEKRFCKEAVMWKRLKHRNIVALIGVTQDPLQFVSEWMPNGILTEYLEEHPDADRIRLLLDVAEGLSFLHTNHTTHGDLKGPNILIDHDGHARLTDFGFASVIRGLNSVHITKVQGYTAKWAAPEVLRDGDKITREADVFAFGMVVIEVFTGMPPFHELPDSVTMVKIVNGERPGRPRIPTLTDSVWNVTRDCWLQEPTGRPTMAQVIEILCECRGPSTPDPRSPALTPLVLAEGTHNAGSSVPVTHLHMDRESTSAGDSSSPPRLSSQHLEDQPESVELPVLYQTYKWRIPTLVDPTGVSDASHYGTGYHHQQGQGTGYHLYPQDPVPDIHPQHEIDPQGANGPYIADYNRASSWREDTNLSAPPLPPLTRRQIVVPQRPYGLHRSQGYYQFFSEDPITFPQRTGMDGIPLKDLMDQNFDNLIGRDDEMFASYAGPAISLRLEWPCYKSWAKQIKTRDRRREPKPTTKRKLAYEIAKGVRDFIMESASEPMAPGTERWQVGPGFIEVGDLVLSRMVNVSRGSWQPELLVFEGFSGSEKYASHHG